MVVGLIWSVGHWPLVLKNTLANPELNTHKIIVFFTTVVTLLSFVFSWFFKKSRSVWSAVILHSAHNSLMGGTFDNILIENDFYVGETGVVTMIILIGFVFIISHVVNSI